MANINPWRIKGHTLLESAQRQRSIIYRARAIDFLKIANAEPEGEARALLRELAAQYEELADELEHSRRLAKRGLTGSRFQN